MAEVLVLGSGGREQAIAQFMEASSEVDRVVVDSNLQTGLEAFGRNQKPFVVVGPEAPLVEGVADELRQDGYTVFGVGAEAAQYEASKAKTTKLARAANVVHPKTYIAEGSLVSSLARAYVCSNDPEKYVIKADGLAGGKGVVLPESQEEAMDVVDGMLSGKLFGGAGAEVINFQDRHSGPEVSALVVVGSGKDDFVVLPLSQDHKRLMDGDNGPNTGGMGAYAPVPEYFVNQAQLQKIHEKAYTLLDGMEADGVAFDRGVMYMGLMMPYDMTDELQDESMLIEINVRFGDPETQAVLPLLQRAGVDGYRFLRSAAEGQIERPDVNMAKIGGGAVSVCLAAPGYPESPQKGMIIQGLNRSYKNVVIQTAGVKEKDDQIVTNGGRVLYVTGVNHDRPDPISYAAASAYDAIGPQGVHFDGMQYRSDIAWQVLQQRGI